MKLAKKVLACVVAFALMSVLAVSAFAADAALSVAAPETAEIGQEITVTAKISNAAGLESAAFILEYDPAALEFVNVAGDATEGAVPQAGKSSDGAVTAALAYTTAATVADRDLMTVTFKVLKDNGSTEVKVSVLDDDISGIDNATAGSAVIKFAEKATAPADPDETTAASTTAAPDNTTKPEDKIPETGDAGIAVAAGLVVLAGAAFVASKKSK